MGRDKLSSPFTSPHPVPDRDGDRRDVHDHNPSQNLNVAHDRGKDTPAMDFVEGMPDEKGHHAYVPEDILSTPMLGQRRATGEYDSMRTECPSHEIASANRDEHQRLESEEFRKEHEKEFLDPHR